MGTGELADVPVKLDVVGILTSTEYQKCKCYVQKLHKSLPKLFLKPDLRPMLDFDWDEFVLKKRRKIGGEKLWALRKAVAVFLDGEFLGDDESLNKYLIKRHYSFGLDRDYQCLGQQELREYVNNPDRDFAYLTIAIGNKVVDSLETFIQQLYSDIVPETCENFIRLCLKERGGFLNAPVHRIVKDSWIQVGGYDIKPRKMICENYCVAHDRRGVLAMCNKTKHVDNTRQFLISLNPQPWMTYYYVAFGQVAHGHKVLKYIERVRTDYESPTIPIRIVSCGKYTFNTHLLSADKPVLQNYLNVKEPEFKAREDVLDPRNVPSEPDVLRYKRGLYCLPTDLKETLPLKNLPCFITPSDSQEIIQRFEEIKSEVEEECYDFHYDATEPVDKEFFEDIRNELQLFSDDSLNDTNYDIYDDSLSNKEKSLELKENVDIFGEQSMVELYEEYDEFVENLPLEE